MKLCSALAYLFQYCICGWRRGKSPPAAASIRRQIATMIGCPNLETLTSEISRTTVVHERGTQTKEMCAHVRMVLKFKFDASKCKARTIASELQNVPSDI